MTNNLHGIYNLADDEHPTQRELLKKVCDSLNIHEITWQKTSPIIRGKYKVSNTKIKKEGYSFIHPKRVIC